MFRIFGLTLLLGLFAGNAHGLPCGFGDTAIKSIKVSAAAVLNKMNYTFEGKPVVIQAANLVFMYPYATEAGDAIVVKVGGTAKSHLNHADLNFSAEYLCSPSTGAYEFVTAGFAASPGFSF